VAEVTSGDAIRAAVLLTLLVLGAVAWFSMARMLGPRQCYVPQTHDLADDCVVWRQACASSAYPFPDPYIPSTIILRQAFLDRRASASA